MWEAPGPAPWALSGCHYAIHWVTAHGNTDPSLTATAKQETAPGLGAEAKRCSLHTKHSVARPERGSSHDGMNEQRGRKPLPPGKGRVKEVMLGAQGPDSEPGPTLPGQRVSGGLRLGGGGWWCVLNGNGQYWPVPRSELARPWRLLATSTVYSLPVVRVTGLPRTAINGSLAARSQSPHSPGFSFGGPCWDVPSLAPASAGMMERQRQPHPQPRADYGSRAQPTWDPLGASEPPCDPDSLA